MPIERLYYKDNYLNKFSAEVLSSEQQGDKFAVELSQTAFYPEGGGQPSDIGFIDGVRVVEVQEVEGKVLHMLISPLELGKEVHCNIDWNHRFLLMQCHTGEHIVSGIVSSLFGYENVGFHIGADAVTLDFNGELSPVDLQAIEQKANEVVYQNIATSVSFPTEEELIKLIYRSKKELSGDVRIVKVGETDCCACCGIHVKNTGEVGIIKFISSQKYKGGTRLTMLCGSRAAEHYSKLLSVASETSTLLSAKIEAIPAAVSQLKSEAMAAKEQLKFTLEKLCALKSATIELSGDNVFYCEDQLSKNEIRLIASGVSARVEGVVMVLGSKEGEGYSYGICSSKIDVRPLTKHINAKFNGKGGGSSQLTQGSLVGGEAEVEQYFRGIT